MSFEVGDGEGLVPARNQMKGSSGFSGRLIQEKSDPLPDDIGEAPRSGGTRALQRIILPVLQLDLRLNHDGMMSQNDIMSICLGRIATQQLSLPRASHHHSPRGAERARGERDTGTDEGIRGNPAALADHNRFGNKVEVFTPEAMRSRAEESPLGDADMAPD